ncbi:MAG: 16S rRNA (uracil(1498)-N(3))-methyltransferase [Candidatus Eisenbacteria bacterium]|nr:16S rRNA (uracil(1498)-N(3))-methyltransferase [Candidatus Eisenbacteria bacterium]
MPDWTLEGPGIWRLDTFRVPPGSLDGASVVVDGAEGHHAVDVVRVRGGDVIRLIDGQGAEALARVENAARGGATASLLEVRSYEPSDGIRLTVCQALLKGRSFDEVVRRCAEIGVAAIVPLVTERAIARLPEGSLECRKSRWEAVALAAVKQARGVFVPRVGDPVSVNDVVDMIGESELSLVAWEEEGEAGLFQVLERSKAKRILLIVGPEGGLTRSEVDLLAGAGALAVSAGRRILRADWAAAAIAAMLSHQLGGLRP